MVLQRVGYDWATKQQQILKLKKNYTKSQKFFKVSDKVVFLFKKISFLCNFIYLFTFGCIGSSLLCGLFSSCDEQGLLSSCGAWASHCNGFFCGAWAIGHTSFSSYLWHTGLVVLWPVGSSRISNWIHVSSIVRQIFYHWVTREAQWYLFSMVQNSEGTEGYTGKSCPLHCRSTTQSCPFPAYPFRMSLCRDNVLFHFCLAVQTFVLLFFLYWYILGKVFLSVKKDSYYFLSCSSWFLAQGLWKAGSRTEALTALSLTWDRCKSMTFLLTAPWDILGRLKSLEMLPPLFLIRWSWA